MKTDKEQLKQQKVAIVGAMGMGGSTARKMLEIAMKQVEHNMKKDGVVKL
jgi:energy-coupling factor transporter ATP-binding protein EcfA2